MPRWLSVERLTIRAIAWKLIIGFLLKLPRRSGRISVRRGSVIGD
jgi:hypothetical protein